MKTLYNTAQVADMFTEEAGFCDALADILEPSAAASADAGDDAAATMLRGQAVLARQISARLLVRARQFTIDSVAADTASEGVKRV